MNGILMALKFLALEQMSPEQVVSQLKFFDLNADLRDYRDAPAYRGEIKISDLSLSQLEES